MSPVAGNLVEIAVVSTFDGEGMEQAKAQGAEAGDAADDLAASQDRAAESARGEAAALDESAAAAGRSADAQKDAADAADDQAVSTKAAADAQEDSAAKTDLAADAAGKGGHALRDLALGAGVAAAGAIYMGMKFQEGATQLVTGAGQSAKGLKQVEQGMLDISTQTATSSKDVEAGMYMIESAGYHGAAGLDVLRASAMGAKAGNAQLADVANVVTSAMNAYHEPAARADQVTNQLLATVQSGKMHMQDLATAMASVLPAASQYHVSLAQVGGALATMTMQGMTARRGTTDLAFLLRGLAAPGATAQAAMQAVGLSAKQVSDDLSTKGLTGTLQIVDAAITKNTHSSYAAREAMLAITGGATGLNTALLLTGKNSKNFADNVKTVGEAGRSSAGLLDKFKDVTGDTSFKLDQAKISVENLGTSVGLALLPAMDKVLGPVESFVSWIGRSKIAIDILAGAIIGALAGYAVVKSVEAFQKLSSAIGSIGGVVKSVLTKMGLMTAATEEQAAATGEAEAAQDGLNLSMLANPITLIIAAIALLVVAFVELWKHCAAFRDFWKDAWRDIEHIAEVAWHDISAVVKAAWSLISGTVKADVELVTGVIKGGLDVIKGIWDAAWTVISDLLRADWDIMRDVVTTVIGVMRDIIAAVMAVIEGHWSAAWHDLQDAAGTAMHGIASVIRTIGSTFINILYDAGRDIIMGLIHGIESAVGGLMSTVSGLAGDVTGAFKDVLGIFSPSRVFAQHGKDIVGGLTQGIDQASPLAIASMRHLASQMSIGSRGYGALGAGPGGAAGVIVRIDLTGGDSELTTWLKNRIRVMGGGGPYSVQKALGATWPRGA